MHLYPSEDCLISQSGLITAKHFVDCVNRKIERIEGQFQSTPQVLTQVNQVSQVETLSDADELRKFKELLDEGIITEDEFNLKKKQILGLQFYYLAN